MTNILPWLYNHEPLTDIPENKYGFVYRITNLIDGRMYIGRKYFWSTRKVKGKRNRKKFESDWKEYFGSSKELLEDLEVLGKENFKREIISLHETKGQTNYAEIKLQFQEDVLYALDENDKRIYYNKNIMSRYFSPEDIDYELTSEKLKEYWKNLSDEDRQKRIVHLSGEQKSKRMLKYWSSLTQEEKEVRIEHLKTKTIQEKKSKSQKKWFENATKEQYDMWYDSIIASNEKRSKSVKEYWKNLSDEQRNDLSNKMSKSSKNRPSEVYNSRRIGLSLVLDNGEIINYKCRKDAYEDLGISRAYLTRHIKNLDKNKWSKTVNKHKNIKEIISE